MDAKAAVEETQKRVQLISSEPFTREVFAGFREIAHFSQHKVENAAAIQADLIFLLRPQQSDLDILKQEEATQNIPLIAFVDPEESVTGASTQLTLPVSFEQVYGLLSDVHLEEKVVSQLPLSSLTLDYFTQKKEKIASAIHLSYEEVLPPLALHMVNTTLRSYAEKEGIFFGQIDSFTSVFFFSEEDAARHHYVRVMKLLAQFLGTFQGGPCTIRVLPTTEIQNIFSQ